MLKVKDGINTNAATATTLQTARTINGTSFNGSANITTANWGTARTLTIGNTGKSVNGSANISWSLSEIGAASSSHNHDNVYVKYSGANSLSTILSPSTDNIYDLGKIGYRWKTIYGMTGWFDSSVTISSDEASNTGWKLHGEQTSDGNYYSKIIALHKDSSYGLIQFHHNNNDFLFSGSLHPTMNDNYTYVGFGDKRWKGAYFREEINSWNGNSGYQLHHFSSTNLSAFTLSCLGNTGEASAAIYLYNDGNKYLSPVTDCDIGLGRHGQAFRDVWAQHGTIQTCDMNAKENIKLISNNEVSVYTNGIEASSITEHDLYNFIRNINVYSYNYKSYEETNDNETNAIAESSKQFGILAQELKNIDEKIWEFIGINANEEKKTLAAIKQGSINGLLLSGLKTAINKIEKLENKIQKIEVLL